MFPMYGQGLSHGANKGGGELRKRRSRKPIVGYRSWLVTGHPRLKSIHVDYIWQTDNIAACLSQNRHDDPAPSPSCACGLYAATPDKPLDEWWRTTRGRIKASGTVALSGRVIVCEYGYKAERALIQSPVVVELECGMNRQGSCWEPVVGVSQTEPVAWCEEHGEPELVDWELWVAEMVPGLEQAYPDIEFWVL